MRVIMFKKKSKANEGEKENQWKEEETMLHKSRLMRSNVRRYWEATERRIKEKKRLKKVEKEERN